MRDARKRWPKLRLKKVRDRERGRVLKENINDSSEKWRESGCHRIFVIEPFKGGRSPVKVNSCSNQWVASFLFLRAVKLEPPAESQILPSVCALACVEGKSHLKIEILRRKNLNFEPTFLLSDAGSRSAGAKMWISCVMLTVQLSELLLEANLCSSWCDGDSKTGYDTLGPLSTH